MSRAVPDDPAIVQPIFEELKQNFLDGRTRSVSFRKQMLQHLLDGYQAMQDDFNTALKKDLGQSAYMATVCAHSMTIGEIQDNIDNLASWVKPEYRTTPIGRLFIK